jgi:geranylgeranyl diphosphate synthase type I
MARLKTGALFGAACAMGASPCDADPVVVDHLDRYGQALGLAFQISDDLLGLVGDPRRTGKPVGGDLRQRKRTYPVLAALSSPHPAAARLREAYRDAKDLELPELVELTVLIEETGACAAARLAAREALDQAEAHLRAVAPNPARTASLRALTRSLSTAAGERGALL